MYTHTYKHIYATDIEEGHRALLKIKEKRQWNIIRCHPLFRKSRVGFIPYRLLVIASSIL